MRVCTDFLDGGFLDGLDGVVFDCDGVLFDSWEVNKTYYNLIREGMGLGPMDADMEAFVHAHAVRESVEHITPEGRLDEAQRVRASLNYADLIHLMRPEPGLAEMLAAIRGAGLWLGVYTNRTTTMHLVLERFDLGHFFHKVVTAGDVRPKPDPEGMYSILSSWRTSPDRLAYVGDTRLDQIVAEKTGTRFWAYKSPLLDAEMHVDDFWCLGRHFQRLGKR